VTAYTYRPDLLPFAAPTRIGLPYHGLVTDGQLALPGGGTKAYSQPATGCTVYVQHPLHSTPPADPGNPQYAWQDYAVLSGSSHMIGGQALGGSKWIYCDATRSWVVGAEFTSVTDVLTVNIYCYSPFGLLENEDTTYTKRLLGTTTITLRDQSGAVLYEPSPVLGFTTHSASGAVTALNWFSSLNSYPMTAGIFASLAVTLSGNGSIAGTTPGTGITASFSNKESLEQLWRHVEVPDEPTNYPGLSCTAGIDIDIAYRVVGTEPDVDYYADISPPTGYRLSGPISSDQSTDDVAAFLVVSKTGTLSKAITFAAQSGRSGQVTSSFPTTTFSCVDGEASGTASILWQQGYDQGWKVNGTVFGKAFSYEILYSTNGTFETDLNAVCGGIYGVGYTLANCSVTTSESTTNTLPPPLGVLELNYTLTMRFNVHTNGVVDVFINSTRGGGTLTYVESVAVGGTAFQRTNNATVNPSTLAVTQGAAVCWV
jgi:hypothetical protein